MGNKTVAAFSNIIFEMTFELKNGKKYVETTTEEAEVGQYLDRDYEIGDKVTIRIKGMTPPLTSTRNPL